MAGRSCGATTRANVRHGPWPNERAVSSHDRSSPRSAADTGRNTNGKYDSVVTRLAPNSPVIDGRRLIHA